MKLYIYKQLLRILIFAIYTIFSFVEVSAQIFPEIPIQGSSGYWDIQSNGACQHYLSFVNGSIVHAVFLSAPNPGSYYYTKTVYSFSTNSGDNWEFLGEVPIFSSGLPSLTAGTAGSSNQAAIIANKNTNGICVNVDILPGIGAFVSTCINPPTMLEPIISNLSNGNILVVAVSNPGTAGVTRIFNPNTHQWVGQPQIFVSSAYSQDSMCYTTAGGPNGKAIFVIDAYWKKKVPLGGNKIVYWTSTDNGTTWSGENLLFQSHIETDGDTVVSWSGLDAIYDLNGNFYIAFNTIADSLQTAKMWVSKNGTSPVLAASNLQIPGSAKYFVSPPLYHVSSMDWPSLSIMEGGENIFCSFSVLKQNDIVNGFQAFDVYYCYSPTNQLNFQQMTPIQVTTGLNDERYVSLNKVSFGNTAEYTMYMVYSKDPQPGTVMYDNSPIALTNLIFRKIHGLFVGTEINSEENPSMFSLSQNYPNPFNPVTKIKFSLPFPSEGEVKLTVFDILGRKIANLIPPLWGGQEGLSPGTYEVEWDGTNYPSGVYFYQLSINNEQSATRKMVLVK